MPTFSSFSVSFLLTHRVRLRFLVAVVVVFVIVSDMMLLLLLLSLSFPTSEVGDSDDTREIKDMTAILTETMTVCSDNTLTRDFNTNDRSYSIHWVHFN